MTINPYLGFSLRGNFASPAAAHTNSSRSNCNNDDDTSTMGCQSQRREGAIKKCLKRGTRVKFRHRQLVQAAIGGGLGFISERDCKQCIAIRIRDQRARLGLKMTLPHRGHNKRCRRNIKTKGLSEKSVTIEREAAHNVAQNNIPPVLVNCPPVQARQDFFKPRLTKNKTAPEPEIEDLEDTQNPIGTWLRRNLDARMHQVESGHPDFEWVKNATAPGSVAVLVDFIVSQIKHHRPQNLSISNSPTQKAIEAQERYHEFFGHGSCVMQVPVDPSQDPSPYYHSLERRSIGLIDWELSHPEIKLQCYACDQQHKPFTLVRDRSNFGKNRGTLFPIWNPSGIPTWCSLMWYECHQCHEQYAGNDGHLLAMLCQDMQDLHILWICTLPLGHFIWPGLYQTTSVA